MNILVTGANGFIGSRFLALNPPYAENIKLRGAIRLPQAIQPEFANMVNVGNIGPGTVWTEALQGIDVVVHLAARVHVMHDSEANALNRYRQINLDGTLNLAQQAANHGVKRFIFMSSIKVNGEETLPGQPFSEDSTANPVDPYALSKFEAEEGLKCLCESTGMQYVIIRPALIYGPGVKANYRNLIDHILKGFPLPLGCVANKRSMLALDNLIDFIYLSSFHPAAANQTFLLSDGEDLSTKDLVERLSKALGLNAKLLPVPTWALKVLGYLTGKQLEVRRLIGSLQIDSSKSRNLLNWIPPVTVDKGINITVENLLENKM